MTTLCPFTKLTPHLIELLSRLNHFYFSLTFFYISLTDDRIETFSFVEILENKKGNKKLPSYILLQFC
jgi:hypothetical protein